MKFGAKLIDNVNISFFTNIISTIAKLCAKAANEKSCILKLSPDTMHFILPEFSNTNNHSGTGRTSFYMSIDPKSLFDFFVVEGKSENENVIFLEIQPESVLRAIKSNQNQVKMVRIRLSKRQTPCITIELDLHSMSSRSNSRTITHDIPIKIISASKLNGDEFQEPSINRTNLSIELPPLKLLKHMIERMKSLSEFVYLEATNQGTLTVKVEAEAVSVSTYFRKLTNLPIASHDATLLDTTHRLNELDSCTVRLSLKRLAEFLNSLQYDADKMICNFVNKKYAHFFVVRNDNIILQYLISSVLS